MKVITLVLRDDETYPTLNETIYRASYAEVVETQGEYLAVVDTVQQMFGKDSGGDAEPISHRLNK